MIDDPTLDALLILAFPGGAQLGESKLRLILPILDIERLQQLIDFHRVWLTVATNVAAMNDVTLPTKFVDWLKQQQQIKKAAVLKQFQVQSVLSYRLSALAIKHKFIKGLDLAQRLYGDIGQRYARDIDLLVQAKDLSAVHQILHQMQYQSVLADLPRMHVSRCLWRYLYKDFNYCKHGHATIELHWRVANEKNQFANEISKSMLNQQSKLSSAEFVYLSWHATKTFCHRLKWLLDLAVYQQKLAEQTPDWQAQCYQLAREYNVLNQVELALCLVQLSYPSTSLELLQFSDTTRTAAQQIKESWAHPEEKQRANLQTMTKALYFNSNSVDNIRTITMLCFAPAEADLNLLNRLPLIIGWLLLPLLPFLKAARYMVRMSNQWLKVD